MEYLDVLILSVMQGVLEWLPVSSSGQLLYVMFKLLNVSVVEAYKFSLFLHVGTALAVIIRYWRTYVYIAKCLFSTKCWLENKLFQFITLTVISSTITAAPLYMVLSRVLRKLPGDIITFSIGILLIVTGLLMMYSKSSNNFKNVEDIKAKDAVFIGMLIGLSIVPGISRSGITMAALLLYGLHPLNVLELSFILGGIVTLAGGIMGASTLTLNVLAVLTAIIIPLFLGYIVMSLLLKVASTLKVSYFTVLIGVLMVFSSLPYTSLSLH